MKQKYSFLIGIFKSIKNVAIVSGVPALVLLLDNWTQWIPNQYNAVAAPIIGLVSYLVNNWIKNK